MRNECCRLTAVSFGSSILFMSNADDGDIETADTERPTSGRGVLVINDTWSTREPTWFASLIEATTEPPRSDMALIHANHTVLARGVIDGGRWLFSSAGQQRLEAEARGTLTRDQDHVLAILLAEDFAKAAAE